MREIKFRGKRLDNGDWVYGDLVRIPHDGGSWGEPPSQELDWHITNSRVLTHEWVKIKPETLGQFTGLLDNNGKEIYEGDIVAVMYCNDGGIYKKGKVEFSTNYDIGCNGREYGFNICGYHCQDEYLTDCMIAGEAVIIGNIYENGDLLNKMASERRDEE